VLKRWRYFRVVVFVVSRLEKEKEIRQLVIVDL